MSTNSSTLSRQERTVGKTQQINDSLTSTRSQTMLQPTKTLYQAAQQVKFLHLQAEVESLLQELKFMKQQRLAAASCDAGESRN